MESINGKVAIVTGASSGIGLATVRALLKYGAKVFACDISPKPASIETPENFRFFQANLAEPGVPDELVKRAVENFGGVNVLLNVAGVMDTNNSVDTLTDELWERTIAINLTAPVKLMRAVIPHMIQAGGGSIVNVSSKAGISGAVAGVAYTSSKHGIIGATKNVAFRFRANRIRCNAICPGGVQTNITQSIASRKMDEVALAVMKPVMDVAMAENGVGMATPEAQANVLVFLASDMSSEISGAILPVDHGFSVI